MTLIVVQRAAALGDVILTTPVIRRLRRENPEAGIAMVTGYPNVFGNTPHFMIEPVVDDFKMRFIDLNLAYERNPDQHIVTSYMQVAFGEPGDPHDLQQELFFPRLAPYTQTKKWIAVHAAVAGWANRTLPRETWRAVVKGLSKAGYWPILIGTEHDDIPDCEATRFFTSDIAATGQLIAQCACFVGSDSGVLHIAGATDIPIVGIFTCALASTRLPWRDGVVGGGCTAIAPDIACVGCLPRRAPPVTTEFCERGDTVCVKLVDPDEIIEAVIDLIE